MDLVSWDKKVTKCRDEFSGGDGAPALTRASHQYDQFSPSAGDVGYDQSTSSVFSMEPWVNENDVDVPAAEFSVDSFVAKGAYRAGERELAVLLANRTSEAMAIVDIRLEVEQRRPVPSGTLARIPGGDPTAIHALSFNLNEPRPIARAVDDECRVGAPFFSRFFINIAPNANQVLEISLNPGECLCFVRLHIRYRLQGQWHEISVPKAGQEPIPVVPADESKRKYNLVYIGSVLPDGEPGPFTKYDCRRETASPCRGS